MTAPAIVWFRQDLRLDDNAALLAAARTGAPVLPLYILDDETPGAWAMGGASRWWLHHSLTALAASLEKHGLSLVLRRGPAGSVLQSVIAECGADTVYWNRCYEPFAIARDTSIKASLKAAGLTVETFNAALLCEPWTVKTKAGEPFKVFTPFWRACQEGGLPMETHTPPRRIASAKAIAGDTLPSWKLLPSRPDWAKGFAPEWAPGEAGAKAQLAHFIDEALGDYADGRDRPDLAATSRLSPHLHFGEIGPRQVVRAIRAAADRHPGLDGQAAKYLSEIGWREFSYHLLHQFPGLPRDNFRPEFDAMPWLKNAAGLKAWQRGQTGIPIVDAGMRQLWQTGWMHNRVRMVVASFLVKHLMIDWRHGAAWFWDTLVDADLANNSASWQWVAGCGADAAPYFRVFNPVLQGEKFDPDGDYVRRFVPELAELPGKWLNKPWQAPPELLSAAGITLGRTYPEPIVDLQRGRERALAAFAAVRNGA
ncbi:MAG: deoxyribodipyrimidine photo-lyase [Micropepsaceae bacterium]